jgi:hypothetical protein
MSTSLENGRQAQSKYMPLFACTNMSLSAIPIKNSWAFHTRILGDCCCRLRPSSMVSLFLDFAAEITGFVVVEYDRRDNSYYVLLEF